MKGNSFVMYRSYYNTYLKIKERNPQEAFEYIDAILNYGFIGDVPDEDSPVWMYGLDTTFSTIDASISRYERAENNNGGRPRNTTTAEQIYEQMALYNTWKEVASALNIDEDTLRKLRNHYNITERSPKNYRKTEKQNHDSFSALITSEIGKTEIGKTEKPQLKSRKTSVFQDTILDTSISEISGENRKTEKENRKAEKPKNLNDNDNVNGNNNKNFNDKNRIGAFAPREKTEKISESVEQKNRDPLGFSFNDDLKTEEPKKELNSFSASLTEFHFHEAANNPISKRMEAILNSPLISEGEAAFLMEHSDLPLYRVNNKLVMENDDREWIIQ